MARKSITASWPVIELRPEPEGWMSHIWRWLDGEWRRVTDEPMPTAQAQGVAAYMRLRAEMASMSFPARPAACGGKRDGG